MTLDWLGYLTTVADAVDSKDLPHDPQVVHPLSLGDESVSCIKIYIQSTVSHLYHKNLVMGDKLISSDIGPGT